MSTNDTLRVTAGIGAVVTARGSAELVAYALGSCVALCLYDPIANIGAMAHILLPSARHSGHENSTIGEITRYADHALDTALEKMCVLGALQSRISAAIIGGAMMFPLGNIKALNIGEMNVQSVIEELSERGIPLSYLAIGGTKSRTVRFTIPGTGFETQICINSPKG